MTFYYLFLSQLLHFIASNKFNQAVAHGSLLYCHLGSCQNRLATVPNDTNEARTNDDTVAVRTQRGEMSPSGFAVGTNNTFYINFPVMSAVLLIPP